jgi:hypothetical protein
MIIYFFTLVCYNDKKYWGYLNMRKTVKVGDIVNVINKGHTYNTYTEKAIELRADVSDYLMDCRRGQFIVEQSRARSDTSGRWVYGQSPNNGDIGIVINKSSSRYILIERMVDSRQFVLDDSGLRVCKNHDMFSNKDFEL